MKKKPSSAPRAVGAPPAVHGDIVTSLTIQFPPEGTLRHRRIISRSAPRPTTKYLSVRLGRWVHCESSLECDVVELLDACPAVKTFAEQAVMLSYSVGDEVRTHYPDVWVKTARRRAIVEVKFLATITDDDLQRAHMLRPLLAEQGYEYLLVDETHINRHTYLANARFLLRRGRVEPSEVERVAILHLVMTQGMRLGDIVNTPYMAHVAWMVLMGFLIMPMRDPFTGETQITTPGSNEEATPWALELFM
jgi:hypothetical protein